MLCPSTPLCCRLFQFCQLANWPTGHFPKEVIGRSAGWLVGGGGWVEAGEDHRHRGGCLFFFLLYSFVIPSDRAV